MNDLEARFVLIEYSDESLAKSILKSESLVGEPEPEN